MVKKKKSLALFYLVFLAALVIADQLTKFLAKNYLPESLPVIGNIFQLTFVKNFGIAFGLLQGINSYMIWIYIIVLGLIIYFHDKFPKDRFSKTMIFFLIAGLLGNLIDRIAFGYVIDFFDFRIWPVFNLADVYLNIGIIGLIAKEILKR